MRDKFDNKIDKPMEFKNMQMATKSRGSTGDFKASFGNSSTNSAVKAFYISDKFGMTSVESVKFNSTLLN